MADEIFARTSRLATNPTYNITKDKNFVNQLQINLIKLQAVLGSFGTIKIAKKPMQVSIGVKFYFDCVPNEKIPAILLVFIRVIQI
ncbi:hypothetical protein IJ425_09420 [bacterium]|nr:hypothetical protein [bacterium]